MSNALPQAIIQSLSPWITPMKPCGPPVTQSLVLINPKQIDTTHRPTDRELLQALADAYQISPKKAHSWWYEVDFDALSDVLICEMREAA